MELRKWRSAMALVILLVSWPCRADVGLNQFLPVTLRVNVEKALRGIDFSEKTLAQEPHVQFVSAESTALTGTEITNRIHFYEREGFEIWMMRQRQSEAEGADPELWSLVGIIVDRAQKPAVAYFLEFAPSPVRGMPEVIAPRVPCLRCHPNGPRMIRPKLARAVPDLDAAGLRALVSFNRRAAKAGVIEGYDEGHILSDRRLGAEDTLTLPKCVQCHDAKAGVRNFVRRQNAGSVLYLTTHGRDENGYETHDEGRMVPEMPIDDVALTVVETACLYDWMRRKVMAGECGEVKGSMGGASRVGLASAVGVGLHATVTTTLGSFVTADVKPRVEIACEKRVCRAHFEVPLAEVATGIAVRDAHLRKYLGAKGQQVDEVVALDFAFKGEERWEKSGITSFVGTFSVSGKASQVPVTLDCEKRHCRVLAMTWDLRKGGWELPSFLGIEVKPLVEIAGDVVMNSSR